ncbi:DUF559 domain-containing protein [Microbacterium sp. LRZ72]|uniref:type IV toxin-antitoxin system AbiEi family antitoxin domain-containing protein n=1 Tax=Microbacterium sp. LRZ72 TaxID=2942481 RepID=UPI0029A8736C|nr:type IV toxin-antitoxin system AbiEi family antitoxin domain-containing protein [Microbacterium sp. LRZ72]MDX2375270.1 DUF559 domain-containing protein [Microbacterium sp. LRZ72]
MEPLPSAGPATARLLAEVRRRGGVARAMTLRHTGHSPRRIAEAVDAGLLQRVRRVWVALPDADVERVSAARHGVVLSCLTQARRRGLWVLGEECPHVAAGRHSRGARSADAIVHWSAPLVPRHPDDLEDPIENVLALVASCQPRERALVVWESALNAGLVDRAQLAALPLKAPARELLDTATPFSDSGLETLFCVRLRWLRVRIIPQVWLLGHRVDFLIGERLVVQIDGGHHVGAQRTRDIAHHAALLAAGYHVIRLSYEQVIDDWPAVQDVIARAVAAGRHRAS